MTHVSVVPRGVKERMGQLSSKCFELVQRFHHSYDEQQ